MKIDHMKEINVHVVAKLQVCMKVRLNLQRIKKKKNTIKKNVGRVGNINRPY